MLRLELDAEAIRATCVQLSERINDRFPGSSLHAESKRLTALAERAARRSVEVAEPIRWVRVSYVVLGVLVLVGLLLAPVDLTASGDDRDLIEWAQVFEAVANDVILLGAGIAFLVTAEARLKRRKVLRELHQLRSFAHVIDMHQLAKNPQRIKGEGAALATEYSPAADLSAFELGRYLDYCSELLSLDSKVAALYVQHFDDGPTLVAVTEIEQLTTGLSRKIWQKLMILMSTHPEASPTSDAPGA